MPTDTRLAGAVTSPFPAVALPVTSERYSGIVKRGENLLDQRDIMDDFLTFRRMISSTLLMWFWWVSSVVCIILGMGLATFPVILDPSPYIAKAYILGGLTLMIFGPILLRLLCEAAILFFRINETLTDVREILVEMNATAADTNGRFAFLYRNIPQLPYYLPDNAGVVLPTRPGMPPTT
jgi:hypothetical protein